jgi:hypothetical protein
VVSGRGAAADAPSPGRIIGAGSSIRTDVHCSRGRRTRDPATPAAEFPGTWRAWWDAWWAKHVAEHKEWLEWLDADSGLSFWDWQKQRKETAPPR